MCCPYDSRLEAQEIDIYFDQSQSPIDVVQELEDFGDGKWG